MENEELHHCIDLKPLEKDGYGIAVDYCIEDEKGILHVGNGEYQNSVNYCPFCGYKAKVQKVKE